MTTHIEAWLASAVADAERRGLPQLKPLLETLARSTAALRQADDAQMARGSRYSDASSAKPDA